MKYWRHLFTPHHSNNFRARVLHNSSLFIFSILFILLAFGFSYVKTTHPSVLGISYSITKNDLLDDTNKARLENGESELKLNEKLNTAAQQKADYMFLHNFWAHFAPDGTTPWSFIKNSGYDYVYAGENLAKGFTSSSDIVKAWMNSPSHRENMLSSKYKDVGFAVVEGNLLGEDTILVVQIFGAETITPAETSQQGQKTASQQEAVPAEAQEQQSSLESVKKEVLKVQSQDMVVSSKINSSAASKSVVVAFLLFIITILVLDILIVEKKKIPRIVGHNLDHIILLILFLTYVILTKAGGIL